MISGCHDPVGWLVISQCTFVLIEYWLCEFFGPVFGISVSLFFRKYIALLLALITKTKLEQFSSFLLCVDLHILNSLEY